MANQYPKN